MHASALRAMTQSISTFVPTDRHLTVVDLGSATDDDMVARGQTHGALFAHLDAEVIGLDIVEAPNVDRVMRQPYRLPMRTNSADVVVSGQVFEHVPFFWASLLEVARILKPGGVFIMTVPSRGHKHMLVDCWRYYDDGMRAMAAFSGLTLRRARTDYIAARSDDRQHHDFPSDRLDPRYWGDTVGVFEKPLDYPTRRMAAVRGPVRWWANRRAADFTGLVEEARERREAGKAAKAAANAAASL